MKVFQKKNLKKEGKTAFEDPKTIAGYVKLSKIVPKRVAKNRQDERILQKRVDIRGALC